MIVALLAALATATPAAPLSPQEIFDRTFTRLASYPVAPYAVEIATRHEVATSPEPGQGGVVDFAMRYTFRSSDRTENATLFPPPSTTLPGALLVRAQLGAFAWSMRRDTLPMAQHAGEPSLPDVPEPLKTIAHVVVYAPPHYTIEDVHTAQNTPALEAIDGHECYHLRLSPLSDPGKHNLRELWVDTKTYDLRKAAYDGSYRPVPQAPSSPTTFTSTFAPAAQYWIVSRQHWTWTDVQDDVFVDINMEVNKIVFPATLPDFLFDRAAYEQRRRAGTPDPLDAILNGQ